METVEYLFSFVCGQARPFVVDGLPLPVSQRCLGLYAGALLTLSWLLATGLWRRGLPSHTVLPVNAGMLVAAMLGGLHVVDPGPLWRFGFGLWTGHVAVLWLAGAAGHFRASAGPAGGATPRWRTVDRIQGLAFPAGLAALAALFPLLLPLGWHLWTAAASAGVAALAATVTMAAVAAAHHAACRWRPEAERPRPRRAGRGG